MNLRGAPMRRSQRLHFVSPGGSLLIHGLLSDGPQNHYAVITGIWVTGDRIIATMEMHQGHFFHLIKAPHDANP